MLELGEPALEAQEPHAAALPAVGPELGRAAGDGAVARRQSRSRWWCRDRGRGSRRWRQSRATAARACLSAGRVESRRSHDGLRRGDVVVRAAAAWFLAELAVVVGSWIGAVRGGARAAEPARTGASGRQPRGGSPSVGWGSTPGHVPSLARCIDIISEIWTCMKSVGHEVGDRNS